jgi:hypothetical protein
MIALSNILGNTASGNGGGVYVNSSPVKRRETTAGEGGDWQYAALMKA